MSISFVIAAIVAAIGSAPARPLDHPPVKQAHCFKSPRACGFPAPSTTGVPKGVALKPSGSIQVTDAGSVVSGVEVTGTIEILADDVTIEDSRVTQDTTCGSTEPCGNYAIGIGPELTGIKIEHVETRSAPGQTCEQDVRNTGSQVSIVGAYMHACDGNVYAAGPTRLKDSYGKAKIAIATDHIENVYFNETRFTAIHDTLLNPVGQTAVIFGNSGGGTDVRNCSNHLTVVNSLLAGGGYTLYPCAHSEEPGSSTLDVEGNHFARCASKEGYEPNGGQHPCVGGPDSSGYYANSGAYGIATDYFPGPGATWRGNGWDDDLAK
ncbi:MAG TPA: hypothetical protein VHA80_07455, partial [Solirubrobacterales bacterium]|nr:hypothetical protein [Solirubrobacterales bacterium]